MGTDILANGSGEPEQPNKPVLLTGAARPQQTGRPFGGRRVETADGQAGARTLARGP
jgi:hypothetical protein